MKQHHRPAQVQKLQKHSWGVVFHWPSAPDELVDGFDSKRQAKAYKAKAADIIALRTGAGR